MAIDKALYGAPVGVDKKAAGEAPLEIEIENPDSVELSIGGEEILDIIAQSTSACCGTCPSQVRRLRRFSTTPR